MASISIFTFDHDPPRVSSPWSTAPVGSQHIPQDAAVHAEAETVINPASLSAVESSAITKLEAEPQDGPTEYKLHLLLRRRRSFLRTTTGKNVSGSLRRVESPVPPSTGRTVSEPSIAANISTPSSAIQSRQHRLEQLTTQLFWRLQQSCPHHISSSTPLVVPQFPNEAQLSAPATTQPLLPGLEESRGALYEIGVADDGTFVGLAEDEMEESLNNLRAMAASLGCRVDVHRKVQVGECEWYAEGGQGGSAKSPKTEKGKLWVIEAFVYPNRHLAYQRIPGTVGDNNVVDCTQRVGNGASADSSADDQQSTTQQLRVSLTGATMSGKSSLLGSLSTSTLDNGRGKSRLSLLKHRHEIASGMTSSVTQELIGYRDVMAPGGERESTQVVSYGTGDVSDWAEMHASTEGGRLVFLSDSAGHPRFRRTTVRGLVGWDPHWTLLCIPADSTEDPSLKAQEVLGPAAPDVDLSQAHLQLCLSLELPLIVVITKFDLATKQGLRLTLSKILSAIKDAGRVPKLMANAVEPASDAVLNTIMPDDFAPVEPIVQELKQSSLAVVPIILTSAVKGTGVTRLHAFLRELPIPANPPLPEASPSTLFHIEDVYTNIFAPARDPALMGSHSERSIVIGGHLRHGILRIGSELLLGPYAIDTFTDDSDSGCGSGSHTPKTRRSHSPAQLSRSFPGALRNGKAPLRNAASDDNRQAEWRRVRITSIRNLRLPVRTLHAGQVGTIGVAPVDLPISNSAVVGIRKGMILADGSPTAHQSIMVRFNGKIAQAVRHLSVGSGVVVYVASVRASAKVVSVAVDAGDEKENGNGNNTGDADGGFGFGFDDEDDAVDETETVTSSTVVTFQFIASKEFYEMGAKVLVLPGGGPGLFGGSERGEKGVAALEGLVGYVTEGF